MEKNMEREMNQAKSLGKTIIGGFYYNGKTPDAAILCIAALFYLKKRNALTVKKEIEVDESKEVAFHYCKTTKECLCYNRSVVENEGSPEFRVLLDKYITEGRIGVEPSHVVALGRALIENDFSGNDLLLLLDYIIGSFDKRQMGIYSLPTELLDLMEYFLRKDLKQILDPFDSMLDFAIKHPDRQFTTVERNGGLWELGLFKLAIAGILEQTHYIHSSGEEWIKETFDAVITIPPFGVKLRMGGLNTAEDAENVAFKYFIGHTNQRTGQMISIVPMSFLSAESGNKDDLRGVITENNWLDTVVYLPRNIFPNTGVATALVVLNKQRKDGQKICFLDATKCYTKSRNYNILDIDAILHLYHEYALEFTKEAILDNGSSWNLQWEIEQRNAKFNDSDTVVKVADIMMQLPSQTVFDETAGHVVGVKELSGDVYQYEKKPEDFPIAEVKGATSKVVEPVILLSLVNVPKPTYCIASEETPIFIKNDVCAYRITSLTIHIGYLCLELSKRLKAFNGSVIPRLTKNQILNTLIGFPSLDSQRSIVEQKNIFEAALKAEQLALVREKGLESVIEALRDDYLKNIHARKHAMTQNTSTLALAWDNLLDYLENSNGVFSLNDIIGKKHPLSVRELIDSITTNIRIIDNQAQHLTEVEYEWGKVEEFYIQDFITDYIKGHKSTQFKFVFEAPETVQIGEYNTNEELIIRDSDPNWKLRMPQNALRQVFDNIVSNAISHGFTQERKDYCISFEFYYDFDSIVLEICNNGEPMQEGVNTEYVQTYGNSTKLNQFIESEGKVHSGIGGFDILNILKKYDAEYEVFSTPDKIYTVCYLIKFHDILKGEIQREYDE